MYGKSNLASARSIDRVHRDHLTRERGRAWFGLLRAVQSRQVFPALRLASGISEDGSTVAQQQDSIFRESRHPSVVQAVEVVVWCCSVLSKRLDSLRFCRPSFHIEDIHSAHAICISQFCKTHRSSVSSASAYCWLKYASSTAKCSLCSRVAGNRQALLYFKRQCCRQHASGEP